MNDMTAVIVPKSDQINAEDFLAGPGVFTIDDVSISPGTEQPVSIKLAGEKRVWRPCKSMSRVLVSAWGPDARQYLGRSVRLFCDPNVTWGGMKVGGIRISHMSHIEREMVIALTATKGKKVMATIKPLQVEQPKQERQPDPNAAANWANEHMAQLGRIDALEDLDAYIAKNAKTLARLKESRGDLHDKVLNAYDVRRDMLTSTEGRADQDMGEGFNGADQDEAPFV